MHKMICKTDRSYFVEFDQDEVFPDDPGQGTPVVVRGPRGSFGTFQRVMDTGEMSTGDGTQGVPVPEEVMVWLEDIEDEVNLWLQAVTEIVRKAP